MKVNTKLYTSYRLKSLPEYLIYNDAKKDTYNLFSTKTKKIMGSMQAYPEFILDRRTYYPNEIGYNSLYIANITSFVKGCGVGTALINLAKKESIRRNCEGRIHLVARNITGEPDNIPIIFYRKLHFNSQYSCLMKNIDAFLKGEKALSTQSTKSIPMYMPVDYYCKKFNYFCNKKTQAIS